MNIDELARSTARRTSSAAVATTDPLRWYPDLVRMRRRRTRTVVAFAAALSLAVGGALWAGSSGLSSRHTAPAVPAPTQKTGAKLYKSAPPLCGKDFWTTFILQQLSLSKDVRSATDVGGVCPSGPAPGHYLSVMLGQGNPEPFAFSIPADWSVSGVPSNNAGDPMPAGGGILVRSLQTGDGFAITVWPIERDPAGDRRTDLGLTAREIATWAAAQHALAASPVKRTTVDDRTAWQVDFTLRPGAPALAPCIVGGSCAPVFGVRTEVAPGPGAFGVLPGGQSRALLFSTLSGPPVLVWIWGHAGSDDITDPNSQIRAVVDTIDLGPRLH